MTMLLELIRLYIAPFLKLVGFERKGTTWNKEINGVVHVIDVQTTRPRTDGSESFTINIGVFINELWQLFWRKDAPRFVNEVDCYPRFRLGYLISDFDPKRRDKWWVIQSQKDIETIGKQIEAILRKEYLPFLDQVVSLSDVLDISIKAKPRLPSEEFFHAILLNLTGHKAEADQLINSLCSNSHWSAKAAEITARLQSSSSHHRVTNEPEY